MWLLDEQFLKTPWYRSRQMAQHLRWLGHVVGRKRIRRLMAEMGLGTTYQHPGTMAPPSGRRIYSYLLHGLPFDQSNEVLCADMTYIPMRSRFLYLVAVMAGRRTGAELAFIEHHERGVLQRCIEGGIDAVRAARDLHNSNQGSQFPSPRFTTVLTHP